MLGVTTLHAPFFLLGYCQRAVACRWSKSILAIHKAKGSCGRKTAQVKAHVKSYVNEGNSVTTPSEPKTAIESRGGIPGVRVAVVETGNANRKTYKLEGINTLNNFSFSDQGFYAFRAYDIGPGKFFDWKIFETG